MAKQTFTTGQVLTAAQMTSLQQTAMLGGAATAKTVSYILTANDAGTSVVMNSASSTTITVNSGLFAAGDTVFIQNFGTGVCTVTAGTATVGNSGLLALPQNDAGILYFISPSSAVFYDFVQDPGTGDVTLNGTQTLTNKTLTSPVLGGTTTTASGNLVIEPASYILEVKGGGSTVGQIQLNCPVNTHGQKIASQLHAESATNTLTLPGGNTIGNSNAVLVSDTGTQTLTNKKINLAFNAQTGTTYTLVAADSGKLVTSSNAAAVVITVPPSVFVAGEQINVASIGVGLTSFAQGAGVTITSTGATSSAPILRARQSAATVICTASNTFLIVGDLS